MHCPALAAALLMAVAVVSAQPARSPAEELPVDPLQYLLLQRLVKARLPEAVTPSPEALLARDLVLLAKAAGAGLPFHHLPVQPSAVKTFCHVSGGRQCRDACFYIGDSACIDGDLAMNGNDNSFLEAGFHPGK